MKEENSAVYQGSGEGGLTVPEKKIETVSLESELISYNLYHIYNQQVIHIEFQYNIYHIETI